MGLFEFLRKIACFLCREREKIEDVLENVSDLVKELPSELLSDDVSMCKSVAPSPEGQPSRSKKE